MNKKNWDLTQKAPSSDYSPTNEPKIVHHSYST